MAAQAEISVEGAKHAVSVAAGQTVLEAARASSLALSFSCGAGVCGTCRGKLVAGRVHMPTRAALVDSDISQGVIVACQALPQTDQIAINFP